MSNNPFILGFDDLSDEEKINFLNTRIAQSSAASTDSSSKNTQGLGGDLADMVQRGALQGVGGLFSLAEEFTGYGQSGADYFGGWADEQLDTLSPVGRESLSKEVFRNGENGLEIGEGMNPRTLAMMTAQGIGTTIPTLAGGGAFGVGAKLLGAGRGLASAASAAGAGAVGGGMAQGMAGQDARETVMNIPDETLYQSKAFLDLWNSDFYDESLDALANAAKVREHLAGAAASEVMRDPELAAVNFLSNAVMGKVFDGLLKGTLGKSRLGNAALVGVTEMGQEGLEEGAAAFSVNNAARNIDPTITDDNVLPQALTGAVVGFGIGAPLGLAGRVDAARKKAAEEGADPLEQELAAANAAATGDVRSGQSINTNFDIEALNARKAELDAMNKAATDKAFGGPREDYSQRQRSDRNSQITGEGIDADIAVFKKLGDNEAVELLGRIKKIRERAYVAKQAGRDEMAKRLYGSADELYTQAFGAAPYSDLTREGEFIPGDKFPAAMDYREGDALNVNELAPAWQSIGHDNNLGIENTNRPGGVILAGMPEDYAKRRQQKFSANADAYEGQFAAPDDTRINKILERRAIIRGRMRDEEVEKAELPTPRLDAVRAQGLDERFADDRYRDRLMPMVNDLVDGGGIALLSDEHGRINGRTKSQNPDWFRENEDLPSKGFVKQAVVKALSGAKMGAKQARAISAMLDAIDAERSRYDTDQDRAEWDSLFDEAAFLDSVNPDTETELDNWIGESGAYLFDPGKNAPLRTIAMLWEEALNRGVTQDELEAIDRTAKTTEQLARAIYERYQGNTETAISGNNESRERAEAQAGRDAGEIQGRAGSEESILSQYTEQELADRAKAQADADAAAQSAKAQVDKDLNDFTLSGSGLPADIASSRGQNSLLGAPKRQAKSLRGEKLDGEWRAFAVASGSKNIPRSAMPQVKAEHRGALANFLKARGITGTEETVAASELKPTQAEFSEAKVQKAKEFTGGDRAILVSQDGHVVDGHHQWIAKHDNNEDVRVIRLGAPIEELLERVKEFPSADVDQGAKGSKADQELKAKSSKGSSRSTEKSSAGNQETKAEPQKKLADSGEELGANRRRSTGLTMRDFEGMNDAEQVKMAVKAKIWPKPDYEALINDGMNPLAAYTLKHIYDSMAVKPDSRSEEGVRAFVETTSKVRDVVMDYAGSREFAQKILESLEAIQSAGSDYLAQQRASKSVADSLKAITHKIYEAAFPENDSGARWGKKNPEGNRNILAIGGNRFIKRADIGSADLRKAVKEISEGWPAKREAWEKQYTVTQNGDKWVVSKMRYRKALSEHDTREAAIQAARDLVKVERQESFKEPSVSMDHVERIGEARREGDVTADQLRATFGFRGVNFGNWMNAADRQQHTNAAYDAFLDLAEVMGVPPESMSLGGMLGVAFGAQGHGSHAAAHFVPGLNEINITKTAGAGSLAHEFGHAIDHHFGVIAGLARQEEPFLSEHADRDWLLKGSSARPEIITAYKAILAAMEKIEVIRTAEDMEAARLSSLASSRESLDRIVSSWQRWMTNATEIQQNKLNAIVDKLRAGDRGDYVTLGKTKQRVGKNINAARELIGEVYGRAIAADQFTHADTAAGMIEYAVDAEKFAETHKPQQSTMTEYRRNARDMDAKKKDPYWSTRLEMFARAFETYVLDKLKLDEKRNDYLTAAWKNLGAEDGVYGEAATKWFPQGGERAAINKAFDGLIDVIEVNDEWVISENTGSALYSSNERDTQDIHRGQRGANRITEPAADQQPAQGDLFNQLAKKSVAATEFYSKAALREVDTVKTGVEFVKSPQDAAHVLSSFRKNAQENMLVLVLDKDDRPLSVIRHTKGAMDSASVNPEELAGAVAATPGAAKIYLGHNHPSGMTKPSDADRMITDKIVGTLEPSGIDTMGHVILGEGAGAYFFDDLTTGNPIMVKPLLRKRTVPVTESKIIARSKQTPITSADIARVAVKDLPSGVLFLNTQNAPAAFVPMTTEELSGLRGDGYRRLLETLNNANAKTAILNIDADEVDAAINASRAINNIGMRVLDVFIGGKSNAAVGGRLNKEEGIFYSRTSELKRGATPKGVGRGAAKIAINKFLKQYKGADDVTVKVFRTHEEAHGTPAPFRTKGGYDPKTDTLFVYTEALDSLADLEETLQHELLVHKGLGFIDPVHAAEFLTSLRNAAKDSPELASVLDEVERVESGRSDQLKAEEILARIAQEKLTFTDKVWNRIVLALQRLLKRAGFNVDVSAHRQGKDLVYRIGDAFAEGRRALRRDVDDIFNQTTDKPAIVAELTGDEIRFEAGSGAIAAARQYYRDNIQGTTVTRSEVGEVRFSGKGWHKLKRGLTTDDLRVKLIPALKEIVGAGQYHGREALYKERSDSIVAFHFFSAYVSIAGKTVEAGVSVAEDAHGNLFYNLNHDTDALWEKIKPQYQGRFNSRSDAGALGDRNSSGSEAQLSGLNITILSSFDAVNQGVGGSPDQVLYSRSADISPERVAVLSKIGMAPDNRSSAQKVKDTLSDWWAEVMESFIPAVADKFYDLKKISTEAYMRARMSTNTGAALAAALGHATPEWHQDGLLKAKRGSKGLLEILKRVDGETNEWIGWMVGKRAESLMAQGRENLLTAEDIATLLDVSPEQAQRFQATAEEWQAYNGAMLDIMAGGGLITQEDADYYKQDPYYIPFYREVTDETGEVDVTAPFTKKGLSHQKDGIEKLKGGTSNLQDPLKNMLMNVSRAIDASVKNNALRRIIDEVNPGADNPILTPVFEGNRSGPNVIRVRRDGENEWYRVHDLGVLGALTAMNDIQTSALTRALGIPKRLLTAGVTATPTFMLRNAVRDITASWVQSEDVKWQASKALGQFRDALKIDDDTLDMMMAGSAFMGGYRYSNDATSNAQALREQLRAKGMSTGEIDGYLSSIWDGSKAKWEWYREKGERFENMARLKMFKDSLASGHNYFESAYKAKDLMDFSLHGRNSIMHFLIQTVPFMNARIQGLYKLGRVGGNAKNDATLRKLLAVKGASLMAVSLALYAINEDDEKYQELPDWDKDANWHLFFEGEHIRIPKPFELGLVFGTIPERMARLSTGDDDARVFFKSLSTNVLATLSMNPVPQALMPIGEAAFNYDLFRGRTIDNQSDLSNLPGSRKSNYTSEVAKGMGALFESMGITGDMASPKRIDHIIKGYTGSMGISFLSGVDAVIHLLSGNTMPAMNQRDYPVIGWFAQGDDPVGTKYSDDFYRLLERANQAYRTARDPNTDSDRRERIMEDYAPELRARQLLNTTSKALSTLRKQRDAIYKDNSLSADEKRNRLNRIQEMTNAIQKRAVVAAGGR